MSKTFDRKDVFSWANCEEAEKYIGKKGYFADSLCKLQEQIESSMLYTLSSITESNDTDLVFGLLETYSNALAYGLFLPADKVKEVEEPKKWRAFKDLDDFKTYTNKSVGSVLVYREKNNDNTMATSIFTDYVFSRGCIILGIRPFTFETLFQDYELLNEHAIWQPFGAKE